MALRTQLRGRRVASLAAVEVRTERGSQLLGALALLVQTASTLSCRGLATVSTATVGRVSVRTREHTELLVVDDG